jgi:hypothetical protein
VIAASIDSRVRRQEFTIDKMKWSLILSLFSLGNICYSCCHVQDHHQADYVGENEEDASHPNSLLTHKTRENFSLQKWIILLDSASKLSML